MLDLILLFVSAIIVNFVWVLIRDHFRRKYLLRKTLHKDDIDGYNH